MHYLFYLYNGIGSKIKLGMNIISESRRAFIDKNNIKDEEKGVGREGWGKGSLPSLVLVENSFQ